VHLPLYGFAEPASRTAVTDAAAAAVRAGARVSLDLSSVATMRDLGGAQLQRIVVALAPTFVFANADEARSATELGLDLTAAVFIVKRGGDPVLVIEGDSRVEVPVDRVEDVLDSTGAGDAFAAGCITAALSGSDPHESARAGSELAMSALRRAGAL
jgi:sugar/nucleoside kinase (ribokinase family)